MAKNYEEFMGAHSWRVVDQDYHRMPVKGARYYAVVWPDQDFFGSVRGGRKK